MHLELTFVFLWVVVFAAMFFTVDFFKSLLKIGKVITVMILSLFLVGGLFVLFGFAPFGNEFTEVITYVWSPIGRGMNILVIQGMKHMFIRVYQWSGLSSIVDSIFSIRDTTTSILNKADTIWKGFDSFIGGLISS